MKYIKSFNEAISLWKTKWIKDDNEREIGSKVMPYEIGEYVSSFHNMDDYDDSDLLDRINKYKYFKYEMIDLSKLDLDEFQLDDDKVEEYIKDFNETGDYPAIVVGLVSGDYTIIDGLHRANAIYEINNHTDTKVKAFVGYRK